MDRKALETKILECVSITYKKPIVELSMETTFKTDLGGASIMMVALTSLLENELDVLVPLPTVGACKTLSDLTDKVEELF